MGESCIHVHSMRASGGEEVLVARVVAGDGRIGFGFSFRLDATEARHMAEWHAGSREGAPECRPTRDHPWEHAWLARKPIPWELEPAFGRIAWLP